MAKRRKAKRYKSAEDKRIQLEHEQWLRSRGIPPRTKAKPSLSGVQIEPTLDFRNPNLPPTSDRVPGYYKHRRY